jgi:hypothetical protein
MPEFIAMDYVKDEESGNFAPIMTIKMKSKIMVLEINDVDSDLEKLVERTTNWFTEYFAIQPLIETSSIFMGEEMIEQKSLKEYTTNLDMIDFNALQYARDNGLIYMDVTDTIH